MGQMKKMIYFVVSLLIAGAVAYGGIPPMNVTVSDASGKAAFKGLGRDAVMPHPGTDALAELQSFLADNDDGLALEARCRAHESFGVAVLSARN